MMADRYVHFLVVVGLVRIGTFGLGAGCRGVEYSYIVVAFFPIAVAVAGGKRDGGLCLLFEPDLG